MTITKEQVKKLDSIISKGLCSGLQDNGFVCIAAAIALAVDGVLTDESSCVSLAVRNFSINLNDKDWKSPESRAQGLKNLGIAQLGSKGIVNDIVFIEKLSTKIIQILIVDLFRKLNPNQFTDLVELCEKVPTYINCRKLANVANAYATANADAATYAADTDAAANVVNAYAAAYAAANAADAANADATNADAAAYAANAAANATDAANSSDKYLKLVADLAVEVLKEMNSPGCAFL